MNKSINSIVSKAVEVYNKYRALEAEAEVLKISGNKIIVKFKGSFCETCGVNDWIEDFKYVLEDLNVDSELERIHGNEKFRIGVFRVKRRG